MPKPASRKTWTVMVYLAGDNDLDSAGVQDLSEMKKVGSTDQVDIIAQFDRAGSRRATKRYYLSRGGALDTDVVGTLGETNMGDPRVLKSFLEWGFRNYPAERTMVVLWNHGAGWDDQDVYRFAQRELHLGIRRRNVRISGTPASHPRTVSVRRVRRVGGTSIRRSLFNSTVARALQPGATARAIAFDDTSKDFLDNLETKRVLSSVTRALERKIDVLGMDACLMSMAEVAYQVRDNVEVAVGSEEVEPGDGWPYDRVLAKLARRPTMSAQQLGKTIVDEYVASYAAGASITQSACDLTHVDALARAVNSLARTLQRKLRDGQVRLAVLQARVQVQSYDVPDYIDLYHFCELLHASCNQTDVKTACLDVMGTIGDQGFVLRSGYKGKAMQHSHGCAIYFPQKRISPLYATLDFTKQTAWDEFIEEYLKHNRLGAASGVTTERRRALAAAPARRPGRRL